MSGLKRSRRGPIAGKALEHIRGDSNRGAAVVKAFSGKGFKSPAPEDGRVGERGEDEDVDGAENRVDISGPAHMGADAQIAAQKRGHVAQGGPGIER